jgi:hypothetical protein
VAAKNVALFVDAESLHNHLKSLHGRPVDPSAVLALARSHGPVVSACALADWEQVPESLRTAFEESEVETVQVDRAGPNTNGSRGARGAGRSGRRREVVKDLLDLELLARIIELLFRDEGGPEVDVFVVATCEPTASRALALTRDRFAKEVRVVSVEGAPVDGLSEAASHAELLPMPVMEPEDPEGLAALVPLLEDLEQRKRYLNFKYIRETVVRRLERAERSFEVAERLLSDAIACGVLLKKKVEDKYHPGQLFTAYALDRESDLFQRFGSGEPAPMFLEGEEDEREGDRRGDPLDSEARSKRHPSDRDSEPDEGSHDERADDEEDPDDERADDDEDRDDERADDDEDRADDEEDRDEGGRSPHNLPRFGSSPGRRSAAANGRGRGREAPSSSGGNGSAPPNGDGGPRKRRRRRRKRKDGEEAPRAQTGTAGGGGGRSRGRSRQHQQDRVGRAYEAPSRFLTDDSSERRVVSDDEIDEDRILKAMRGEK